jgi:hypothetical protein
VTQPLGYNYRNARGPIGWLARWWYRRRVKQIRKALRDRDQA